MQIFCSSCDIGDCCAGVGLCVCHVATSAVAGVFSMPHELQRIAFLFKMPGKSKRQFLAPVDLNDIFARALGSTAPRGSHAAQACESKSNTVIRTVEPLSASSSSHVTAIPSAASEARACKTRRVDKPLVLSSERGSSSLALQATQSVDAKTAAYSSLIKDMSAASSRKVLASQWAKWVEFHVSLFGSDVPVSPLTRDKIYGVACLFKRGQYKSFAKHQQFL